MTGTSLFAGRAAFGIALAYFGFGVAWVVGSDWLLLALPLGHDPEGLTVAASVKGSVFVLISAALIYLLVARAFGRERVATASLRESEERFRLAMGSSREAVWEYDLDSGRLYYSPGLRDLLGYGAEELISDGERWLARVHPDEAGRVRDYLQAHAAGHAETLEVEHRLRHHDGSYLWVLSRGRSVRDATGRARRVIGTHVDITERHRLGEELRRANRALAALAEANRAMVAAITRPGLFQSVCRALGGKAGYPLVWIGVPDAGETGIVRPVASDGDTTGYLEGIEVSWGDGPLGQGPVGTALRTGRPVFARDMITDPRLAPWRERVVRAGFHSQIAIPILQGERPAAVLSIYAHETDAFDPREAEVLETLGLDLGYAMAALARLDLVGDGAETVLPPVANGPGERPVFALERIREALVNSVKALSLAVEKRDPYTAGHEIRTAALAVDMARVMGLDDDRIEGIRLGALMHDLGKIAVPAEILGRPGPLSRLEYEMIKLHPEHGHEILSGIDFPWPINRMVLEHHERLDGSGYPRGLKGDEICLEARIVAVADVVEAISSYRPYRPSLGLGAALDEISRNRGRLYDPAVVDACLSLAHAGRLTLPEHPAQRLGL